jgi:hypothetical protein
MGAQKVATGIGLAALALLLLEVGLPAILPPRPVPEIQIVVPVSNPDEGLPPGDDDHPAEPTAPASDDDGGGDDDDGGGDDQEDQEEESDDDDDDGDG